MTPEQFCYWLQGFGELSAEPPTPEQWKAINEHLQAVFKKVTPPVQVARPQDQLLRQYIAQDAIATKPIPMCAPGVLDIRC